MLINLTHFFDYDLKQTTLQFLWYNVVKLNNYIGNLKFNVSLVLFNNLKLSHGLTWLLIDVRPSYAYEKTALYPLELLVGYNNIHPFLLYISYSFIFFRIAVKELFIISKWKTILKASVLVLLLGGYWGLNNAVWGFFWVNDLIEWILVSLIVVVLVLIHSKNTNIRLGWLSILLLFLTLVLYLSRYGLVFTRHNFFNIRDTVNFSLSAFLLVGLRWAIAVLLSGLIYWLVLSLALCVGCAWLLSRTAIKWHRIGLLLFHIIILVVTLHWLGSTPLNFSGVYIETCSITTWKILCNTVNINGLLISKMFFNLQQVYTTVIATIKILFWRNPVIPVLAMTCFYVILVISLMKIYNSFEQKFV